MEKADSLLYSEYVENKMAEQFKKECLCTTPEYTIELNAQGPQGRQGERGEEGFSPQIFVADESDAVYKLRVVTENNAFTTPNLKATLPTAGTAGQVLEYVSPGKVQWNNLPVADVNTLGITRPADETELVPDDNGTYTENVFINPEQFAKKQDKIVTLTQAQYDELVDKDPETIYMIEGDTSSGDVTLAGDNHFTGNNIFAGPTKFTEDIEIHGSNVELKGTLNATSATITNLQVPYTLTSSGEINAIMINTAGIKNNQNNKYYLTQASITAGDNITIEETAEGLKINSTGGLNEIPNPLIVSDTKESGTEKLVTSVNIEATSDLANKTSKGTVKVTSAYYENGILSSEISYELLQPSSLDFVNGFAWTTDNKITTKAAQALGNLKYAVLTQAEYEAAQKNIDTLYRTSDTNNVYLGPIQLNGGGSAAGGLVEKQTATNVYPSIKPVNETIEVEERQ